MVFVFVSDVLFQITRSDIKVKNDHRSKFSNISNWKEEAWKIQGFNGMRRIFELSMINIYFTTISDRIDFELIW